MIIFYMLGVEQDWLVHYVVLCSLSIAKSACHLDPLTSCRVADLFCY